MSQPAEKREGKPAMLKDRDFQWEDPLGYSHDVVLVYPDSMRASAEEVRNIPVPSNSVSSSPAAPEVMSTAHTAARALRPTRAINSSIAAWPLVTFWLNTTLPVSSTAHAWWPALPTSTPTQILSRTATRPVLPFSQLNPVDSPPAAP